MTTLMLERVTADYGATRVLHDFSLAVNDGEFIALLGPSGCGKTTALKIIAGLLEPTSGDVRFDQQSIVNVAAEKRGAVMVFQKPLLFPYLTVAENVAFGLKMRRLPKNEIKKRVTEALSLVQLQGYETRSPSQLSGGQEQRIALARALVTEPKVLLLDEPFSALDESLRAEMRELVRALQQRLKITTVFVTHDQAEAAAMADRIALLLAGKLEQFGPPRDFYTAPATAKAAQFFGWKIVAGEVVGKSLVTAIGKFSVPDELQAGNYWLAFRPENLQILRAGGSSENQIAARVQAVLDLGWRIRYRLKLQNSEELALEELAHNSDQELMPGATINLSLPPSASRIFRREENVQ